MYDAERDKRAVTLRIYNDAMEMGLDATGEVEQTINAIEKKL